ncbi:MAG: efflux RND transporter permease subunit [Deltaproteobacteria bacterium]|nr:MAG: efflux RND transporter permease subunit [Deltaproteobacteria bacterium]
MSTGIRRNAIVETALTRPVMVTMLLVTVLVLGAVALVRIPLELIPSGFSPPFMSVFVPYENATAQDVEERITKPLEQALASTPGLTEISATSTSSRSRITLVFEGDMDMDVAYREVRDRVARVRPELPSDVREVRIRKESGSGLPVAFYGINWDEGIDAPQDLIERYVVRRLERIDGVGVVDTWGGEDRQVRIEVDRELADAAGINIFQLVQRLGTTNFGLASGSVRDGGERFLVRSMAKYRDLDEIRNLVVGQNDVRLGDIAEVLYERPEEERRDRYNGRPSMVVFVVKESQANTVEVTDRIREAMEEAGKDPALRGFSIRPIFLQGDTIRYSLQQVVDSGLQGGVLAFMVLLLFLRRFRLTVIIALSIPLSLFLSLPVMYFTGQTINLVSLIGLMICVGLVVDNSVVVAENVNRYRRRGLGPFAAALQGASEVGLAITLATMTTMVVFLPAALMSSGPTQFFMVRMVTPVCVSLLASLFVALVLIPLASAYLLRDDVGAGRWWTRGRIARAADAVKGILERVYEGSFGRLNRAYERVLRASLRRRIDVVLVSMLAMASTAIPFREVPVVAEGNFGSRNVTAYYSMPSETTIEEADAFFREIEAILEANREKYNLSGYYVGFDTTFGRVQMFMHPARPGDPPFKEVAKELVELLPERPGWRKRSQFGQSDGATDDTFVISLYGDEHEAVQAAKEDLERAIVRVPGVVGIENRGEDDRRRDELALRVDRALAARLGVAPNMVANTVASALRGGTLPRFTLGDKETDVIVRYQEDDREQVDKLLRFRVPTAAGAAVPLSVLTRKEIQKGEARLSRHNKRVAALLRLELDPEDREGTMRRIREFLARWKLPEGITFDADHVLREEQDTQKDLAGAMLLGTVFIFLLMAFLFESFVLPLSVMPSIPLSFVGVWWFLYATGEHIDALAGIGIILLLGVVVNNAIVLIDFVNEARRRGLSRDDAIVAAGTLRFRPILMTALTTIGGMLPLAFSQPTGEGIPYNAFGKALVGGMVTSTVLTLVVVPVAYTYMDDLRTFGRRILRGG